MAEEQDVIRRQTALRRDRFAPVAGGPTMKAVVTTGQGGLGVLDYRDVPVPSPAPGELLLQVLAAGVNTTDVNTRLGWYSASVTADTASTAAGAEQASAAGADEAPASGPRVDRADGGWSEPTPFPLIQGTDCCGRVVAVGRGGDERLIGRRALVRPCMRPLGFGSMENIWMASDFDGAFAQYVKAPASEVFTIEAELTDAELGVVPCSYGTAENMLRRAGVTAGQRVVVTGASGGVGSAAVQLAARRGAVVTAITTRAKAAQVLALGADRVVAREDGLAGTLGRRTVDVVVDNVSGPGLGDLLVALKRGGRYASSGAIAGPIVSFDKRTFYLDDLTLIGCTAWDEPVFPDLVDYLEAGQIRPPVAGSYALEQIAAAQTEFLRKAHVGAFALIPPRP
jgi:NADPH:quinone reductase-like Zn-dependent oxidoreductase